MRPLRYLLILLYYLVGSAEYMACTCPPTTLGLGEASKYEIIFYGVVQKVKACGETPGEATFEVKELFKGNTTREFDVLFKCDDPCYNGFREGEEWIVYTRYKQIDNAMMEWCSRSRKFFRHEKEDFDKVNLGTDFFDELNFLRQNLGLHRVLAEQKNAAGNRNQLPDNSEKITTLLVSIGAIILFYILFRKFFR